MTFLFSKRVGAEPKAGTPRHGSTGALPLAHRAASASPPAAEQRRGESAPTDLPAAIRRAEQAWGQRPDLHHTEQPASATDVVRVTVDRATRDAISACAYQAVANGNTRDAMKALAMVAVWDLTYSDRDQA